MRGRLPLVALLTARGVSSAGTAMTVLALPWLVLHATGSAADTGIVAALELVGMVVSTALGGPVVDRVGPRLSCVAMDGCAGVVVGMVPLMFHTTGLPLWALGGLAVLLGLTRAPANMARPVMIPELAERAGTPVERATSWYSALMSGTNMLAPPVAGFLVAVIGPPQVLAIDAASFFCSAALMGLATPSVGARSDTGGRYVRQLTEALRYVRKDRLFAGLIMMVTVTNALDAGFIGVVAPVYARDVLGSALALGALAAAMGAGDVLGATLYGWRGHRLNKWATYSFSFLMCGTPLYVVFLLDPGLPVLVAATAVLSIGAGTLNPIIMSVLYRRVPKRLQGRVLGAAQSGSFACMPLGSLALGYLVSGIGLHPTIAVIAAFFLVPTACPFVFRIWRQLDAEPAIEPEPATAAPTAG